MKLPASWRDAFGDSTDSVMLSRRFNRPTSLAPKDRVLLRVESPHQVAAVRLGDVELQLQDGVCDITPLLAAANLLTVELDPAGDPDATMLAAQLEIVAPGSAGGSR